MSLDKYFCSSPWFHMRINNQGQYEYCRWALKPCGQSSESFITFFKNGMKDIRQSMINGTPTDKCAPCYEMEAYSKVSGRQKQLLKTGISLANFDRTLLSSSWINEFTHTDTNLFPQDWQIDLGNYCNSACVMCLPEYSSLVARDHIKIGLIQQAPKNSWCSDTVLLDKFIGDLIKSPKLQYLHFIGGETLIIPAFKKILDAVVASGHASQTTVGFTTNLTVWDDKVIDTLVKFDSVHVGLSVEALTDLNDYTRWPSRVDNCRAVMDKWVTLAKQHNWLVQIRTTPTLLTLRDLHTVYDYALDNNIIVESCNFIQRPDYLRPTVLPKSLREQAIASLVKSKVQLTAGDSQTVVNIRNPNTAQKLLAEDLQSYIDYLTNAPDESYLLPKAIEYLKKLESLRGNSVLTYLPEYEDAFRSAGY